jgi:hypothetical protein
MSTGNAQAGSRWQVTLAIKRALRTNLQKHADNESDRLADVYGELQSAEYAGSGVLLRIPTVPPESITVKMDSERINNPANMPAVVIGMLGVTTFEDAQATVGRQAFGGTALQIATYVSTRATYQGTVYRLTEEEMAYAAAGLGQAVVDALRAGGIASTWSQRAGFHNTTVESMTVNGHNSKDDGSTTAAKCQLSVIVSHDMRY